jgi:hypothetical protein
LKTVSNSSVLIGLSFIGKLSLLKKRFPAGIIIPQAVWKEVVEEGKGKSGSLEISSASWISVGKAKDKGLVDLLKAELDAGEAEAIVLAHEIKADVILLDERDARRAALKLGIKVLGTIGILTWAKKIGLLPSLQAELDSLQNEGKFRISVELYAKVLYEVNE